MSSTKLTEYTIVKLPNSEHKEKILHFPGNTTNSKLPLCVGVNEESQNHKGTEATALATAPWQGRRVRKRSRS